MSELLHTIARKCQSILDTGNYTARRVDHAIDLLERQNARPPLRLAFGIIYNVQTGAFVIMSGTNQPIALVNVADPALATRYLGVIDVADGTALPTVASSDTTRLVVVAATSLNAQGQFIYGAYPISAAAEANDLVTVTETLPDGNSLTQTFSISGSGENITLDASSAVGAWTGAPTVPTTPV